MKKTNRFVPMAALGLLVWLVSATAANAGDPAGQYELRVFPGGAQKAGESIVSISARWVTRDGLQTGFTALTFLNGPDQMKPHDAHAAVKRVAHSVRRGMGYMRPPLKGITVEGVKDAEKPYYILRNKEGFTLTKLTIRDFVNDKYTTEIEAKSFGQKGVAVSFDLVESNVGRIVVNFSASDLKTFHAQGGGIDVTIGDGKTVTVDTKGKTTDEIERALASRISGSFSSSPLLPDEREKRDQKNIKPFDGGEVQVRSMSANSFTVEVKDHSLGIINRYKFPGG